jgi:DNA-binding transcriptional LysR family regulator
MICEDARMDLDKLRTLVELSRRGTMAAVADATGYGTSAVSQQLAALERQVKVPLLEASGRRVRLTPAGRLLVGHAERILADVTAAELALSASAEPSGVVRVAGYTTALRQHLLPVMGELTQRYPLLELEIQEREPDEVDALLDGDDIDLGFEYDYTLVPRGGRGVCTLLFSGDVVLAVHPDLDPGHPIRSPSDLAAFRDADWIGNSRDSADDELAARVCALAGWQPRMRHRADNLDVVVDLVLATRGVCLIAAETPEARRLPTVPLEFVSAQRRMWSVVRDGAQDWPATNAVIDAVRRHAERADARRSLSLSRSGGRAGAAAR